MKFKIGDKIKVINIDKKWAYWMKEMDNCIGKSYTVVGSYTFYPDETCPTILIDGHYNGIDGCEEYAFPEHCLKLIDPQLLFDFMYE